MTRSRLSNVPGRLLAYVSSQAAGTARAADRFPVAVLLIVAFSIVADLTVQDIFVGGEADTFWLLASLYAAAAGSVVGAVGAEAAGTARAIRFVLSAGAALVIGLPVWHGLSLGVYPVPLIVAATLAIPLVPYLGRPDSQRFWIFSFWTGVGAVLAFLSVLIFVIGLSAIIEMVRFLFDVGPGDRAYEHIFVVAFSLVGPLFALGRIPRDYSDDSSMSGDDRLVSGVRILFDWIAAPLALVTALIIHAYAVKMFVTGEVPKNEIGWIVTFFSIFVLSLRIAIGPFVENGAFAARLFARSFAAILVVPLALLFYAAGLRIGAEGWTVERYYLVAGAVASAIVVLGQAWPRIRGDLRFMMAVPVLLLAVTAFGPWGAVDTVGRSQADFFRAQFERDGGNAENGDVERAGFDPVVAARLRSRLYALEDVRQLGRVEPLLSDAARERFADAEEDRSGRTVDVVLADFGLSRPTPVEPLRFVDFRSAEIVDIAGYDRALPSLTVGENRSGPRSVSNDPQRAPTNPDIAVSLLGDRLRIRIATVEDSFDLEPVLQSVSRAGTAAVGSDPAPALGAELVGDGGRRIRIELRRLGLTTGESDRRIASASFTLYLRITEWDADG